MLIQIWGGWIAGSLVWRSTRCEDGWCWSVGGVRMDAPGSFRGWGHWGGCRGILPATVHLLWGKKTKDKIIKCVFQHSSKCKDAGDRLQTPSWNLNDSNHDEFPHYKHAFARSESQSEAVKRNDIMLHITSHFQNMIFKRQMMEESIIANYHIG